MKDFSVKKVSVVIPSYNSANTISYTIESLKNQSIEAINEIIIVDSSDDKETKKVLSKYESNTIKIVNAGSKTMPATYRNLGAAQAQGQILAFIDSDAYPAIDWIETILKAHNKGYRAGGGV